MRRLLLPLSLSLACTLELPRSTPGLSNGTPTNPAPQEPGQRSEPGAPRDPDAPGQPGSPTDPVTGEPVEPEAPGGPPGWAPTDPEQPSDPVLPVAPAIDVVITSGDVIAALRPQDGCLTLANAATAEVHAFEALCAPRGVAAGEPGAVLVLDASGQRLFRVTEEGHTLVAETPAVYTGIVAAADGKTAALAVVPTTPAELVAADLDPTALPLRRLAIVDLVSAAVETYLTAYAVRDVDITQTRVVVTMGHHDAFGFPEAVLQVFDRAGLQYLGDVTFPNCADDLQIHPDGRLAVLAPRTCALHEVVIAEPEVVETWDTWDDVPPQGDPISFVDLETVTHLANVPGFGPAVFSPDGLEAAGFTVAETLMVEWNLFATEPFGVVVARADDYTFDLFDAGDVRPAFAFGPDGSFYVQGQRGGVPFVAVRDDALGTLAPVNGAAISLTRRAPGNDGALYVASEGQLHRMTAAGITRVEGASGDAISGGGERVVVTDRQAGRHTVLSLETKTLFTIDYSAD